MALLKEFEDSLARCTGLYCEDQLGRVAPTLVSLGCIPVTYGMSGAWWKSAQKAVYCEDQLGRVMPTLVSQIVAAAA